MLPLRRLRHSPGLRKAASSNVKEATSLLGSSQHLPLLWQPRHVERRSYSMKIFRKTHAMLPMRELDFFYNSSLHQRHFHGTSTFLSASVEEDKLTDSDTTQVTSTEDARPVPSSPSPKRDEIMEQIKNDTKDCTDKAVRLLLEMMRMYKDGSITEEMGEKPDNELYETVLESLVRHGAAGDRKATALQAQALVVEMKTLYRASGTGATKDLELRPSINCHNHLIKAWSQASAVEPTVGAFWDMLDPTNFLPLSLSSKESPKVLQTQLGHSLNLALETLATSRLPDAGKRCDKFLDKLGRVSSQLPQKVTVSPNPESYHLLFQAWRATVENTTAGTTLMRSPKDMINAGRRIETLLQFMVKRYEAANKQDSEWLPKPETYLWLMRVYAFAGAPDKAQELLQQLIVEEEARLSKEKNKNPEVEMQQRMPSPTTTMYNCVLEAWSRKRKPAEAARLLSQWVSRCQRVDQDGNQLSQMCRPDLISCHLVISAWAKIDAAKAEVVLDRMKEGDVLPAPTIDTYNAVLKVWGQSRHHKITKAVSNTERVLDGMTSSLTGRVKFNPLTPNIQTFEIVMETYARNGFKMEDRIHKVKKISRQMKHFGVSPSERYEALYEICQENGRRLDDV